MLSEFGVNGDSMTFLDVFYYVVDSAVAFFLVFGVGIMFVDDE